MSIAEKAQLLGGLVIVLVVAVWFALFPMYQLLDGSVVRRPVWSPPTQIVREAGQGLTPEDVQRLSRDPEQRRIVESLLQPIRFEPQPSWLGREPLEPHKTTTSYRRLPPNRLLWLLVAVAIGYAALLRHKGII